MPITLLFNKHFNAVFVPSHFGTDGALISERLAAALAGFLRRGDPLGLFWKAYGGVAPGYELEIREDDMAPIGRSSAAGLMAVLPSFWPLGRRKGANAASLLSGENRCLSLRSPQLPREFRRQAPAVGLKPS